MRFCGIRTCANVGMNAKKSKLGPNIQTTTPICCGYRR